MRARLSTIGVSLGVMLCGLVNSPDAEADTELNIPGYRIAWHDEFEGEAVDPAKWEVNIGVNAYYQRASDGRFVEPHWFGDEFEPWTQVGGINDERQYYSPDNVEVVEGVLEIRADREAVPEPVGWYVPGYHEFTSGKLNTADEFQFQHGIVRWRAQLPAGPGLWPALWMLNAPDPWFWDDEIDVMEARGSRPTHTSSAHHFKVLDEQGNRQNRYNTAEVDTGINLQTRFNEYTLQWDPTFLQTWVNQQPVFYDEEAVPQGPMFLIMNAAVGGAFDGLPGPENVFPTYFKIDWVRVWQPAQTPSDLADGGFEDYQGRQWANWNTVDSGNLRPYTDGALHGASSVEIGYREPLPVEEAPPANWFTDGTASAWLGYLNLISAEGEWLGGSLEDPANIPATLGDSSAVLPIHQTAPAARANAVIFREISGSFLQGRELVFSGSVSIEEPFPADALATAFIRIFNADYSFSDVVAPVTLGGDFRLEATIPEAGVPIVQFGLETTGSTGSAGRLAATDLNLLEAQSTPPATTLFTGLTQAMVAVPGQLVKLGLLAANHPSEPLGSGAEGRLLMEFLNAEGAVISSQATTLVEGASGSAIRAFSLEAMTPLEAAHVRLSIERVTLDPELDRSGSFLVDAVFLHVPGASDLPILPASPPAPVTASAGETVSLSVEVGSPSPLAYAWYHDGKWVGDTPVLPITTRPDSAGAYVLVATNDAGSVISPPLDLTILDPDTDGDGISDYNERFISLTDPLDRSSALRVTGITAEEETVSLEFTSVPGVTYQILASPNLLNWLPLGAPHTAEAALTTIHRTVPGPSDSGYFFRVEVVP